jgi:hypothetical protein
MIQKNVSFYDVCHLAVAFQIDATLITVDETSAKRMQEYGSHLLVKATRSAARLRHDHEYSSDKRGGDHLAPTGARSDSSNRLLP